jgi:hypothetical protein
VDLVALVVLGALDVALPVGADVAVGAGARFLPVDFRLTRLEIAEFAIGDNSLRSA